VLHTRASALLLLIKHDKTNKLLISISMTSLRSS